MANKLIYILNDDSYPIFRLQSVQWLKRLDTKLNKPTNQYSLKYPNLLSLRTGKRYYKTLGTSVINSQLSPPSLKYLLGKQTWNLLGFKFKQKVFTFTTNKTFLQHYDVIYYVFLALKKYTKVENSQRCVFINFKWNNIFI